jgi:DNA-binding transcriptional LysR family regulator
MFEDGLLTLAGVQAGLGCALMREPLIAPYLESGELVKVLIYLLMTVATITSAYAQIQK